MSPTCDFVRADMSVCLSGVRVRWKTKTVSTDNVSQTFLFKANTTHNMRAFLGNRCCRHTSC